MRHRSQSDPIIQTIPTHAPRDTASFHSSMESTAAALQAELAMQVATYRAQIAELDGLLQTASGATLAQLSTIRTQVVETMETVQETQLQLRKATALSRLENSDGGSSTVIDLTAIVALAPASSSATALPAGPFATYAPYQTVQVWLDAATSSFSAAHHTTTTTAQRTSMVIGPMVGWHLARVVAITDASIHVDFLHPVAIGLQSCKFGAACRNGAQCRYSHGMLLSVAHRSRIRPASPTQTPVLARGHACLAGYSCVNAPRFFFFFSFFFFFFFSFCLAFLHFIAHPCSARMFL
jgi:hypothetical protein